MFSDFFKNLKKANDTHEIVKDVNLLIKDLNVFEKTWAEQSSYDQEIIENIQVRFDFVGVKIRNRLDKMEEVMNATCDLNKDGTIVMNVFGSGTKKLGTVWFGVRWRIGDINTKVGTELIKDPTRLFPDDNY